MKGERSYIAIATAVVGWLLRIAVGATFIFSGFSKAVDPYGTFYKIGDYVAAWGWHLPDNIVLTGAFGLFSLEFALGLMLLLGCFRRAAAIASLVVMAFMLPLSLWPTAAASETPWSSPIGPPSGRTSCSPSAASGWCATILACTGS